jgi:hypothetical protein
MTKPNGRGRGWRKKAWQDLAPSTQKRYTRLGITPQAHAGGMSPARINHWVRHQVDTYGWVENGDGTFTMYVNGREETGELPKGRDLVQLILDQERAEKAYEAGHFAQASLFWNGRKSSIPEFMYFYHGVFG